MDNIMDYIMKQADRYDIKNLQYENDIIFNINRRFDKFLSECLYCSKDVNTLLETEKLIMRIDKIFSKFIADIKFILLDVAKEYSNISYKNTGDLIEMGNELTKNHSEKVSEQKVEYDNDTMEYISKYAFELLSGYKQSKINKLRADLGYLLLTGKGSKANVRNLIEKTLNTNKSKAEEIAQQELSMAYNAGVLRRFNEYSNVSHETVKKYWHGFQYSDLTCEYCKERIGNIYDINDDSESLPAHIRCRCVWLPYIESWGKPVTNKLISKANMLNTGYSMDMIYKRIGDRLNIKYAKYINEQSAIDYINGDRTTKVSKAFDSAKDKYVRNLIDSWDIKSDNTRGRMSTEYNHQMKFWKSTIASAIANNNTDIINGSAESIKGLISLPWSTEQLQGWNKLLSKII